MAATQNIVKRNGRIVPFDKSKIVFAIFQAAVAVGGRDRSVAEHIADAVVAMLDARNYKDSFPTVEEVQDLVEKCLIENGHAKTAKAFIVYRYEHALKRQGKQSLTYSSENIPYRKLWEALSWAADNQCITTHDLEESADSGKFSRLVEASEAFYQSEIDAAFKKIENSLPGTRILIIAGPSSSGKTTTTAKLKELLEKKGFFLAPLAIDNYFYNLEDHPKDSHGDHDFETPQAIELSLVNDHLHKLLDGKKVDIPFYDFKKGKRNGISASLAIPKNGIILIDSLHGLYDGMTAGIPDSAKFKLYIETLLQMKDSKKNFIRWTDIRMLRRMIRDMQFRNYDPRHTILHWHHVRRSELRYIVSQLKNADTIVNSSLAYELCILKQLLHGFIDSFAAEFSDDPDREDAGERAVRIKNLFAEIPAWQNEQLVPDTSLLREFIGGSVYEQ
ncbi:MAG: hypothetical protein JW904_09045 [Spirochaetales bacterium]|nr:hypothetical protein [Spirochaetales bacterium]